MSATKKKPRARRTADRGAVADRIADLGTAALQLAAIDRASARQNVRGLLLPMPARDLAAYVKNLAHEHEAARAQLGEPKTRVGEHHRRMATLLDKIADAIADAAGGRTFHLHHEEVLALAQLGATRAVLPYELPPDLPPVPGA